MKAFASCAASTNTPENARRVHGSGPRCCREGRAMAASRNGTHVACDVEHDEIQVLTKKGLGNDIGETAVRAIELSGNWYGLRLPLTGEYKIGRNWAETH